VVFVLGIDRCKPSSRRNQQESEKMFRKFHTEFLKRV
jgi:hypothetical protein